jgi:ABC-2 type transport system ATP-binding protein
MKFVQMMERGNQPMPENIIVCETLTRWFGENCAIDRLDLTVRKGEVFGFFGHNGAGKTTTVRLLNGVLESHDGKIRVLGLDPVADGPTLRARTGVLTESASLDNRLSGRDNLNIYADMFGVRRDLVEARTAELLEFFGLSKFAGISVGTYSTGMRQRLALARTLLHDPELLFLDEPTAGLDPVATQQVNDLIDRLCREKGRTVFLCTHNLVEAQKLCDRVAVIEHGRLVAQGTPTALAQQYVRRLDVQIETHPSQMDAAVEILSKATTLTRSVPRRTNGTLTLTVTGREAIPDLLTMLVNMGIRIYRLAAKEPNLEDVYFALHGEKERNT